MKDYKAIAKNILANPDFYQLPYSMERSNVKRLRKILAVLHEDLEILLNQIPTERSEDLDKKSIELQKISVAKNLNEARVRFWVNLLAPDMKNLSEKILNNDV